MSLRKTSLALAASLLFAGPVIGAVDDTAIQNAANEFKRILRESREAGERPRQAEIGEFVDKAFADIAIRELTLDQLDELIRSAPVILSPRTAPAIDEYLAELAKGADASAARAAALRLLVIKQPAQPDEVRQRVLAALNHPGLQDAIAGGNGGELFDSLGALDAGDLLAARDQLVALAGSIRPEAPTRFFSSAGSFFLTIPRKLSGDELKSFAPLREKLVAALDNKLKAPIADADKDRLTTTRSQLAGAFARGELIGHAAPGLDFIWFTDPSDPNRQIKSLDDLKGKVVVLDFWATWCGPCIASFPKVKALNRYYQGFDVVVIGVTSPQNFFVTKDGRVDTKDDPEKEFELTPAFIADKDVTWPIAYSSQPVFNPEYGIRGIPSVVIIDAKGVVRHAGLHPGSPLEEKTALIDPLLAEAGKPVPATAIIQSPASN